ncbi:hypothetical protein EA658_20355 [Pseudoxanthomonas winnipegensis]|uniref:Uncharacterized protein n=1 Tax=Pseudoxanthomonas winnipegensis TaxID=2480810 RepID=A0ABY1W8X2_9GAMM|nr:hypothetical protein [Pseudoxanthomonas winnipegensis]TAA08227.1 hypothetical protein EA659_16225 [Pseudoxanthomonas winnipegensis]TAA16239.1 hypothetical protein EA658_20355 [Pseudoxanthomonas winnipegensis]TAH72688.1 hypothetical protein EA657_10650 [Pseudoxanthomonas winnipegensis]
MTKTAGKAAWAARRARELEEQARALLEAPAADWRARQRIREGAARLRIEAARFRGIAQRLCPEAA